MKIWCCVSALEGLLKSVRSMSIINKSIKHPFIYESNWMDCLLNIEELPAFVQIISFMKDKPTFKFVHDKKYIKCDFINP